MTRRSPNLTPERVDVILEIVRGWEGRLTWPALIKAVAKKTRATYTRQALFNQERIRVAYDTYRASDPEAVSSGRPVSPTLKAALDRIKRLEQENAELLKREALLMEQFARWSYNAASRDLSEDFLNQPLPPTNRQGNRLSRR